MTGPLIHSTLCRLAEYVLAQQRRVQDPTFDVGGFDHVRTVLAHHALQGTLRVEWTLRVAYHNGERVALTEPAGLAVVWRDRSERLLRLAAGDQNFFQWQAEEPAGDCLYLALVLTSRPGVLPNLARYFAERYPEPLDEFAYRRGTLRRTRGLVHRLAAPAVITPSIALEEPAYV